MMIVNVDMGKRKRSSNVAADPGSTAAVDPLIGLTLVFNPSDFANEDSSAQDAPRGGGASQVLPVTDLPEDWQGAPTTGAEYLFLVR